MLNFRVFLGGAALALGSCEAGEDNAAADKAEMRPALLQVIGYPDIEKNDLFGASCAFAPGNGMAPVFLGMESAGHLKIADQIISLAAVPGSQMNVFGFPVQYKGPAFSATLEVEGQGRGYGVGEGLTYDGRLTVVDVSEKILYQEAGIAQCGA